MNKDYESLVSFWDNTFNLSDKDKEEIIKRIDINKIENLAPNKKQFDALNLFKDSINVLDYGCGTGWASIIMAKCGTKHIDAVDVSANSIKYVDLYKEGYKVSNKIKSIIIDEKWLKNINDNTYDGFFSSNVIDVIPIELSKEIIKESARIVKDGSIVIYSLNYYIEPFKMKEKGYDVIDKNIYINNVLRLVSLKDEEWINIFKQYFKDIKLLYYAWPNEKEDKRRLFIMKK